MADPLSIAASVVTLIEGSHRAVKGLQRLNNARHASTHVENLIGEVEDFQQAIAAVGDALREGAAAGYLSLNLCSGLSKLVDKTQGVLAEIEALKGTRLLKPQGRTGKPKASKMHWLLDKSRIEALQERLRLLAVEILTLCQAAEL